MKKKNMKAICSLFRTVAVPPDIQFRTKKLLIFTFRRLTDEDSYYNYAANTVLIDRIQLKICSIDAAAFRCLERILVSEFC